MRAVPRIAELRHPMVGIVLRVVNARGTVKPDFRGGNAEVVVEPRQIGSATQIAKRQRRRVTLGLREPPRVHASPPRGVSHPARPLPDQRPEPPWSAPPTFPALGRVD